jgi:hypothetical protein
MLRGKLRIDKLLPDEGLSSPVNIKDKDGIISWLKHLIK